MDRFRKRELERALERELSEARETWRIAARRYRDLMPEIASFQSPDGNLRMKQLYAEQVRTQSAYRVALDRWTGFVRDGAIPEDVA